MASQKEDQEDNRPIKLFGIILPSLPKLTIRFGGLFLRFKMDAKKGGRVFHKELINQGLDERTADELTEIYLQSSHLKQYIGFLR
jgi:hypothetical protein